MTNNNLDHWIHFWKRLMGVGAKAAGLGCEFTMNIYAKHNWLILGKSGREKENIKLDVAYPGTWLHNLNILTI